jgi:metastasis-associated protein MTA
METESDGDNTSSKKEEEKTVSVVEIKTEKEAVEKVEEKEPVDEELNLKQKNQLNQRELFLSKQVEILPATNIRGKCSVTLLNETESFSSYIDKEVLYYY